MFRPGRAPTARRGQHGPQRLGLGDQVSQAGPAPEQVIDLPHERAGTGEVGECEVGANQLDPGLDGEVGKRVGQQPPRVLGTDEFPARRLGISPVQGHAGSHRADQGCREALLDPGLAQNGACLVGKRLGPVPFAACHRDQRPLAQRGRDSRGRVDLLSDADSVLQGQVTTIEVTAQDARDPLHEGGCRRQKASRREQAHGLIGISAHLFGPAPTQGGADDHDAPRLGGRVLGPGRVPVLAPLDCVASYQVGDDPIGLVRRGLQGTGPMTGHRGRCRGRSLTCHVPPAAAGATGARTAATTAATASSTNLPRLTAQVARRIEGEAGYELRCRTA